MISIACPCGKKLRAKDSMAGKKANCPDCGQSLTIPPAQVPQPPNRVDEVRVSVETKPRVELKAPRPYRHPFNRFNKYLVFSPNFGRFTFWFGGCFVGLLFVVFFLTLFIALYLSEKDVQHLLIGVPFSLVFGLMGGAGLSSFVWACARSMEKAGFTQYATKPKALVTKFSVQCEKCSQVMTVTTQHIGQAVHCPRCNVVFTVNKPKKWKPTKSSLTFQIEQACGNLGTEKIPATLVLNRERLTISGGELKEDLEVNRSDSVKKLALSTFLAVKKPNGRHWFELSPNALEAVAAWIPFKASWMGSDLALAFSWIGIVCGALGCVFGIIIGLAIEEYLPLPLFPFMTLMGGIGALKACRMERTRKAQGDRFEEYLVGTFEVR